MADFEPSVQDEIDIGNIIKGKNLSREEMIKLVVKEGKYTSEQAAIILAEMFD